MLVLSTRNILGKVCVSQRNFSWSMRLVPNKLQRDDIYRDALVLRGRFLHNDQVAVSLRKSQMPDAASGPIPAHTSPLFDFQADEIQANCAEALVNATRNQGVEAAARIHSLGTSPLVLMCGSNNLQVSPPLVQG